MPITIDGTPFRTSARKRTHPRQPRVAGLGEIDAAEDPERQPEHAGQRRPGSSADDRVGHAAARLAHRLGQLGEEVQVERPITPWYTRKPKIRSNGQIDQRPRRSDRRGQLMTTLTISRRAAAVILARPLTVPPDASRRGAARAR